MENKNRKIVLVLDWSNLMFRSLFINSLYGQGTNYDRIEDMRSFIYKFATDVCSIMNLFKPSNVILATDASHAWRKDVYLEYKNNREKSASYNWENIYKGADDLKDLLRKHGVHIANVEHGEADDMAAIIKEEVFENFKDDYNVIIVSADADIRQLISFDKDTKQYCIVYNTIASKKGKKRNMYATKEFIEWINEPDKVDIFFSNVDSNKQYIKDILKMNSMIELCEDNGDEILLQKIFCGDDGDNVPPFYDWITNGKYARITPSKYKKIKEGLEITNVNDLITKENDIMPFLEKFSKSEVKDIDIHDRVNRQRTLVELNSKLFPEEMQLYKVDIKYMLEDIPSYGFWNIKANALLEGTEYESANKKKSIEAEVFKDMSKYLSGSVNSIPLFS